MSAKSNRLKARLKIEQDRNRNLAWENDQLKKLLNCMAKECDGLEKRLGYFLTIDKPDSMCNVARFIYHLSLHELKEVNMNREAYFGLLFAQALDAFQKIGGTERPITRRGA